MWNQANNPFLKALLSVLGMVVLAMALVLPYMTLPCWRCLSVFTVFARKRSPTLLQYKNPHSKAAMRKSFPKLLNLKMM